jgi:7-keto-8-aminopelargonate synthetase-like enzyme
VSSNPFINTVDQVLTDGVRKGIMHLQGEDECLTGNRIVLSGKTMINFGSCSYLGLEMDERMRQAAKEAIDNYGTQFSESRAYVSIRLYTILETLLGKIFENPVVVVPTTTLGHFAAIPVLVNDNDAIVMDHQVHNSVQTAVKLLKARNVHTELVRHNRMDLLEARILVLRQHYKKIWYMADGIYSMFGDGCPTDELQYLLDKYPEFHFYADDAHGMSCLGKNGRGYVLGRMPLHERMIVVVSMAKAFATGGGAIVFPNAELARKVRTCGGPLVTSGPMQPAALGAAIQAAHIHLSDEMNILQQELRDRIRYTKLLLKKYRLPVISDSEAAIFFIGAGLPKTGYNIVKRMLNEGFYVNLGIFPGVPLKNTGVRFTITRLHSFAQIAAMVRTLARQFPLALAEEDVTTSDVYKAFHLPLPEEAAIDKAVDTVLKQSLSLQLQHCKSVSEINREEWDMLFGNEGSFDWHALNQLEAVFNDDTAPENKWLFDYIIVRNMSGQPVVAGFLTTALWKDDMLSPAAVSQQVEAKRLNDPYLLTSRFISTGSPVTQGRHLFTDRRSPFWKEALQLFFEKISLLQEQYEASGILLRDFPATETDDAFESFLVDNGFYRVAMPDNYVISNLQSWQSEAGYYQLLTPRSRRHFRQDVKKHAHRFTLQVMHNASQQEVANWYQLYLNVKQRSLSLNTFTLPFRFFESIAASKHWEVLQLQLDTGSGATDVTAAVMMAYHSGTQYSLVMIGLDYSFQQNFKVYKQALYQTILRAKALGCTQVTMGFTAGLEKKKAGATAVPTYAYLQTKDNYNQQVLDTIATAQSNTNSSI